jgi:hypothetical protein
MYRFLCIFSFFFILSLCVGLFTALCGLHLFFAWHGVGSLAMMVKVLLKSDNMHLNTGVRFIVFLCCPSLKSLAPDTFAFLWRQMAEPRLHSVLLLARRRVNRSWKRRLRKRVTSMNNECYNIDLGGGSMFIRFGALISCNCILNRSLDFYSVPIL